jgi:CAAX protease family protein
VTSSLRLLGLVLGVLVGTALASPWVSWGLGARFSFARVYDRVFEVLLLAAVVLGWRWLDLGSARDIGFRRDGAARDVARGAAIGLVGLAVGLSLCAVFGALEPALRFPPGKTVGKVLLGLAAALAIGIGEEAIFRGVVLRRLGRDFGMRSGVVVTTVIYAAVHVIRRRAGGGAVHVWSGIGQTVGLFAPLADARVIPQLLGLLLLGALLAAARLRARTLWLPIGIHAAFVAGFRVGRLFFDIRPAPAWLVGTGWPPLVGGAAGWVAIAVAGVLVCRRQ